MRPEWLRVHSYIQRKPCGRACRVKQVDEERKRALIFDEGLVRSIWVGFKTLAKDWQSVGAS